MIDPIRFLAKLSGKLVRVLVNLLNQDKTPKKKATTQSSPNPQKPPSGLKKVAPTPADKLDVVDSKPSAAAKSYDTKVAEAKSVAGKPVVDQQQSKSGPVKPAPKADKDNSPKGDKKGKSKK